MADPWADAAAEYNASKQGAPAPANPTPSSSSGSDDWKIWQNSQTSPQTGTGSIANNLGQVVSRAWKNLPSSLATLPGKMSATTPGGPYSGSDEVLQPDAQGKIHWPDYTGNAAKSIRETWNAITHPIESFEQDPAGTLLTALQLGKGGALAASKIPEAAAAIPQPAYDIGGALAGGAIGGKLGHGFEGMYLGRQLGRTIGKWAHGEPPQPPVAPPPINIPQPAPQPAYDVPPVVMRPQPGAPPVPPPPLNMPAAPAEAPARVVPPPPLGRMRSTAPPQPPQPAPTPAAATPMQVAPSPVAAEPGPAANPFADTARATRAANAQELADQFRQAGKTAEDLGNLTPYDRRLVISNLSKMKNMEIPEGEGPQDKLAQSVIDNLTGAKPQSTAKSASPSVADVLAKQIVNKGPTAVQSMVDRAMQADMAATGGEPINLARVRQSLPNVGRSEFDQAVMKMSTGSGKKYDLVTVDNPSLAHPDMVHVGGQTYSAATPR